MADPRDPWVREQYRTLLARELRLGIAAREGVDLREPQRQTSSRRAEILVVFEDELVGPAWRDLAARDITRAHLFIAPVDFASGGLTMVTITGGSADLDDANHVVVEPRTFASLSATLARYRGGDNRVAVLEVPESIDDCGFSYCCVFAELVEV